VPRNLTAAIDTAAAATTARRVIRCFAYARISEDREGAHLATERQLDDIRALAEQLSTPSVEYRIVRVFEDNDLSAYSGKPRPDYKDMLTCLSRNEGDCVLAWHTDRLHRSPVELEEYIDVCGPREIPTRTVKAGDLDLSTATGRMIARQLGVQARYEVERMIERSRRARDQKASHGEYAGGPRPFGYEPDGVTPRTLECRRCARQGPDGFTVRRTCEACQAVDQFSRDLTCRACDAKDALAVAFVCTECRSPAAFAEGSEAALVGHAMEAVLAGASLRAVAQGLADRGVVSARGKKPDNDQLRTILLRPRNAGLLQHRGQIAGRADWMPLVDEATWRSVVAILEDPGRYTSGTNVRKYLGSNIYECSVCGGKLTGFPRAVVRSRKVREQQRAGAGPAPQKKPAYRCDNGCVVRDGESLDDYVLLHLFRRLQEDDAAVVFARRSEPAVDVAQVRTDMRKARQRLDELAEALGRDEMDMQEWRVASGVVRKRLQDAEDRMKAAVAANPVAELMAADDPERVWNDVFDLSRQRAAIDYVMRVRVGKAKPGRQPDGSYFDRSSVGIEWK
jgi:site-specific DNA recombinase